MEIIGFVFIQVIIAAVGLLAGGIFAWMMRLATRSSSHGRKRALVIGFLFPVCAFFYVEAAWLAYGIVENVMGRDSYVEGIYHYRLVGDYQLVIMDKMPEQAYIENAKRPNIMAISEVRDFQVGGNLVIVTSHKDVSGSDWGPDKKADQFFIIDSSNGAIRRFESMSDLTVASAQLGLVLNLDSVQDALSRSVARAQPDWPFWMIILIPIAVFLVWYGKRIRFFRTESLTAPG
jgi:hypothetical protein